MLVGVARLELAASSSQSWRATNCATPRFAKKAIIIVVFTDKILYNISNRVSSNFFISLIIATGIALWLIKKL